ncbi:MAG: hypothetical protein RBG13Loki_0942, partial [Promethearchaeota archaeon CR_4]
CRQQQCNDVTRVEVGQPPQHPEQRAVVLIPQAVAGQLEAIPERGGIQDGETWFAPMVVLYDALVLEEGQLRVFWVLLPQPR